MADHMSADYAKYSQVLGTIDDMRKQREAIERYQSRQQAEEKLKKQRQEEELENNNNNRGVKFYETDEARHQVATDPRIRGDSTDKKRELLELRASEEKKVQRLLEQNEVPGKSANFSETKTSTRDSCQNLLRDVFEELSVGSEAADLDSHRIDEIVERSSRRSSQPSDKPRDR